MYKHKTVETSLDAIPVKPLYGMRNHREKHKAYAGELIGNTVPVKAMEKMYGKYRKISESGGIPDTVSPDGILPGFFGT